MTHWTTSIGLLVLAAIALAGCASGTAAPVAAVTGVDAYASVALTTDYEDALTVRNQLALGTLGLEGTAGALTSEQAATLLPLWQALRGTIRNGASATAEVNALLGQIEETLTSEQRATIAAMRLTQTDLRDWAASHGISAGTGAGAGMGMGAGGGAGLTDEERAARQAADGGNGAGSNGLSTALLDAVIVHLQTL